MRSSISQAGSCMVGERFQCSSQSHENLQQWWVRERGKETYHAEKVGIYLVEYRREGERGEEERMGTMIKM